MTLYYQDDCVTLYHGDSLEILPTLDIEARALLADPPYFKVKDEPWDNQWKKPEQFLAWLGDFLDLAKPLVAANGSVWVFASPQMTTRVELLVGERFNVLNSIRWVKSQGWHKKAKVESLRAFLTPWEGVVFAEQYADQCGDIREYLNALRLAAGMTVQDVNAAWQAMRGSKGVMSSHWFGKSQWQMPTREHYQWIVSTLGVDAREYEDLRREYEDLRRPFTITDRALSTDVWTYPTVAPYAGKHPCEKPQDMLGHMIQCSTREGDTVLDPFAGSGSTLIAAKSLGRKAVGIEMSEKYCEQIVKTLTTQPEQLAFEFTA